MPVASFVATGTACGRHSVAAGARGVSLPQRAFIGEKSGIRGDPATKDKLKRSGPALSTVYLQGERKPFPRERRGSLSPASFPAPTRFYQKYKRCGDAIAFSTATVFPRKHLKTGSAGRVSIYRGSGYRGAPCALLFPVPAPSSMPPKSRFRYGVIFLFPAGIPARQPRCGLR